MLNRANVILSCRSIWADPTHTLRQALGDSTRCNIKQLLILFNKGLIQKKTILKFQFVLET